MAAWSLFRIVTSVSAATTLMGTFIDTVGPLGMSGPANATVQTHSMPVVAPPIIMPGAAIIDVGTATALAIDAPHQVEV
jgi:hypothetical protein